MMHFRSFDARPIREDDMDVAVSQLKAAGGIARIVVVGESMRPTLRDGDVVRIRAGERARTGDIVIARGMSGLIVHRVISATAEGIVLRGDATPHADPAMPHAAILGRVVAIDGRARARGSTCSSACAIVDRGAGTRGSTCSSACAMVDDQVRARRLDGLAELVVGRATAGWSRAQYLSDRWPSRPRPSAIPRFALSLSRRISPPIPMLDALLLILIRPDLDSKTAYEVVDRAACLAAALDVLSRPACLAGTRDPFDRPAHPASKQLSNARAARAENPGQGGVNSNRLVALAHRWQVGPIAFIGAKRLSEAGVDLSIEIFDGLRRLYALNHARQHRVVLPALAAQLDALTVIGIEPMAHKGAALVAGVYPDAALRVIGDIDLSVRDADLERAESEVRYLREELVRTDPVRRDPDGMHVELDGEAHHDVDPAHGVNPRGRWAAEQLDWRAVWERAERAALPDGRSVLVPCPTDLVLTLVANAARRGMRPPRLIVDLAWAVHVVGERMDWVAFERRARRSGLDRRAWIVLDLARAWFGAQIPATLLEPPPRLRMAGYERSMVGRRRKRPDARLPTRVLWAGSYRAAVVIGLKLIRAEGSRRIVLAWSAASRSIMATVRGRWSILCRAGLTLRRWIR